MTDLSLQEIDISLPKALNISQLPCPIHPEEPVLFFCGADNCNQRALCHLCKVTHHSQKHFLDSKEVHNRNIFSKLEKAAQEEGADNPEAILQQAETMFADLKKEMDDAFEQVKKRTFDVIYSKLTRTKSWKTLGNDLQERYQAAFGVPFNSRSKDDEEFTKTYWTTFSQLEKREKEPGVQIKFPKIEFDRISTSVKESLAKQQDRLMSVEYRALRQKPKFDLKQLKKERMIKTEYKMGIKPTAIAYLEDLAFIAMSGNKDIALWSAESFEKKHAKENVHTESVISLVYSTKQKILFSCAWDRTVKLFSVNKDGFKGLVKVLTMPFNSSITGMLVFEDRGIFLGCGQGKNIKIWGLKDYKLKGMIKTGNYEDMGPHMAHCKKENLLAVFFYRVGKIGLICMETREMLRVLDTNIKNNDIISEALLFLQKRSVLLASSEFGKLKAWRLRDRKLGPAKDIEAKGYAFGMLGFEEDDQVLMVNYLKDLQVISISRNQVIQTIPLGLKNAGSIVHLPNSKRFVVADSLSDKIQLLSYN